MKQLFTTYTAYNYWANKILTDITLTLPHGQQHQPITSSFPSIFETLKHLWDVESLWLQRFQQVHPPVPPSTLLDATTKQVIDGLLFESNRWKEFIAGTNQEQLQQNLSYTNMKGDAFTAPIWQLLQHIFNHGTYHRGQLVTMFRQVGVAQLPSTDFVTYTRLGLIPPIQSFE